MTLLAKAETPRLFCRACGPDRSARPVKRSFHCFCQRQKSAVDAKALAEIANPLLDLESMPAGAWRPVNMAESAAIRLAKLARLLPAVVTAPVDPEQLEMLSKAQNLLVLQSESINGYEDASAATLRQVSEARVPLKMPRTQRLSRFVRKMVVRNIWRL